MKKYNGKIITIGGILTALVGLLGLEFWTLINNHKDDTISEVIHETGKRWMIVPFLLGYLMGHWTWPIYEKNEFK